MTPQEIDRILARAADQSAAQPVDPEAVARYRNSLPDSIAPVRPIGSAWVYAAQCVAAFAAVALCGAAACGIHGFPLLSTVRRAVIFPVVLVVAWLAAIASVRAMRPAGGRRTGGLALTISVLAPLTAFAFLFHDYDFQNFTREGLKCLLAGLVCAIPAAAAVSFFVLRRGFILDYRAAGLATGTLAGLAGLGMLELHCPVLKAPHIMFWHVAVVWISGICGWLAGWKLNRAQRKRSVQNAA